MRTAIFTLALLLSPTIAQQCYFPDGSPSSDVPCNGTAAQSACCASTAYCLSNGLCLSDAIPSRGSCTDKSWASGSCAQYCQDSNPSGGYALMSCTNTTFTCGFYPDNCATLSSTFSIDNAGGIVLRDYQLANAIQAAGTSNGPLASATASSTAAPSNDDESHDKKYSATSMIILGVVMAVVFLLIIAALLFLLLRERKLRLQAQAQMEKDDHQLLQQPTFTAQHTKPAYAHHGTPTYYPEPAREMYSPQAPVRVELDTSRVNELDSSNAK